MDLGNLRIDSVLDGSARFRPNLTFRGTTDEQWAAHRDLLDEDGKLPFSVGGFLVRGGDRTVLVDAGMGPGTILGIECGAMLDNLGAIGLTPSDVTDVVFTHLHIDHVGWAVHEEQPVFTNATLRCSQADWDHFMVEHPDDTTAHLEPVRDRFETWAGSASILPGLDAMAAPGHTPGSTVVVASSGAERAMMLGDVVHCPVQLVDDEWGALFDFDPALAKRTRNALARELEGVDVAIAGAHFPGMQFGRLLRGEGKRQWVV
jgi:glyoxylase-like metal-dependent hydrolase (beta-lactamase superfamily II)